MNINVFIAQIINGLAIGSIYALIVVGMNLLLLVRGVMHFAYPHIIVISMYISWMILGATNNNLALALPAGIIAATLLMTLTEIIFRPFTVRQAFIEIIIAGMGISIIFTEIMSHFLNHGLAIAFPAKLIGGGATFKYGMISFNLGHLYALLVSITAVIILLYFLNHSKTGLSFRAMAQNPEMACLLGIPFKKTGIYSFAICGVLAGISGVLLAMTLGSASPKLGDNLAITAVVLILFAGSGNLKGGLIVALLMGLAESISYAYLPGRWTEAIIFGIIMMVIILKPEGLYGARV
jgi:branched-chain amino acid transport system permease protein